MAALKCKNCSETTVYMAPRKVLDGVPGFAGVNNGSIVPGALPPVVWDMLEAFLDMLKEYILDWLKDKDKTKRNDETYRVCKKCGYYEKL